ncbi:MAG TPA: hypothetical protein VL400_07930, partial [Polyangiaceae bacterium]|nr:hypothetical protein [Polyangiaceae bacterium]
MSASLRVAALALVATSACAGEVLPTAIDLRPTSTTASAAPRPERAAPVAFCGMAIPEDATEVFCESEDVADVEPLSRLTKLEKLSLRFTRVTDLSPLAGLGALRELAVQGPSSDEECARLGCSESYFGAARPDIGFVPPPLVAPLEDLRPLAKLTSLEVLRLGGTKVADLSPLAGLAKLRVLDLRRSRVATIPPGALPRGLVTLDLTGAPLASAPGLAELHELEDLDLWGTKLAALPPIGELKKLRRLRYWSLAAQLERIDAIGPLDALEELTLTDAQKLDLSPLRGKTRLRDLTLSNVGLVGLEPLAGLDSLARLELEAWRDGPGPSVTLSLAPLAKLRGLVELTAVGHVGDFASLGKIASLRSLEIGGDLKNWVSIDLAPLRTLTKLTRLSVRDGEVTSHAPLRAMSSLEELRLTDTKAVALDAIGELSGLKKLDYEVWAPVRIESFSKLR